MNWVDYSILGLIGVSTLIGAFRGFARESLGLATWVLALLLAWLFAEPFYAFLEPHITVPTVRKVVAYAGLFFGGLLLGGIFTAIVSDLVRDSRFSSTDRMLGSALGFFRGALIVALLVLVFGMTSVRQEPGWQQSLLVVHFETLAEALRLLIPNAWLYTLQPQSAAAPLT